MEVLIQDIGFGGLRFLRYLRLVLREEIVCEFQMELMDSAIK